MAAALLGYFYVDNKLPAYNHQYNGGRKWCKARNNGDPIFPGTYTSGINLK